MTKPEEATTNNMTTFVLEFGASEKKADSENIICIKFKMPFRGAILKSCGRILFDLDFGRNK